MISLSKRPSRWRMAMTLPALVVVMALACSKDQSTPAQAQITKPLLADIVPEAKIVRDSIQQTINKVFIQYAGKNGQTVHLKVDTLLEKVNLDYQQADPIKIEGKVIEDKVPPPPPPKVERP